MFLIEDQVHAEQQGQFDTYEDAVDELKRRAKIPFDVEPNMCPCKSWRTCRREYHIIEYDNSIIPWKEVGRREMLYVSSDGAEWKISDENLEN